MTNPSNDRSCITCIKNECCFVYRETKKLMAEISTNGLPGNETPGVRDDVWKAWASCCLLYQVRKMK